MVNHPTDSTERSNDAFRFFFKNEKDILELKTFSEKEVSTFSDQQEYLKQSLAILSRSTMNLIKVLNDITKEMGATNNQMGSERIKKIIENNEMFSFPPHVMWISTCVKLIQRFISILHIQNNNNDTLYTYNNNTKNYRQIQKEEELENAIANSEEEQESEEGQESDKINSINDLNPRYYFNNINGLSQGYQNKKNVYKIKNNMNFNTKQTKEIVETELSSNFSELIPIFKPFVESLKKVFENVTQMERNVLYTFYEARYVDTTRSVLEKFQYNKEKNSHDLFLFLKEKSRSLQKNIHLLYFYSEKEKTVLLRRKYVYDSSMREPDKNLCLFYCGIVESPLGKGNVLFGEDNLFFYNEETSRRICQDAQNSILNETVITKETSLPVAPPSKPSFFSRFGF